LGFANCQFLSSLLQKQLLGDYAPVVCWLLEVKEAGVDLLRKIEAPSPSVQPKPLKVSRLRFVRPLRTPLSRKRVNSLLPTPPPAITLGVMKRCAECSEKSMWVDFHWTLRNSFITPS